MHCVERKRKKTDSKKKVTCKLFVEWCWLTLCLCKSASVKSLMATRAETTIIATTTAHVTAPMTHFRLERCSLAGVDITAVVAPCTRVHGIYYYQF